MIRPIIASRFSRTLAAASMAISITASGCAKNYDDAGSKAVAEYRKAPPVHTSLSDYWGLIVEAVDKGLNSMLPR